MNGIMTALKTRQRPARWAVVAILVLVGGLAPGPSAAGHALLRDSVPESGAVLQRAPAAITLTFTEQPEPALSAVHVLDAEGRPVESDPVQPVAGQPLELRVPLKPLSQGVYTVAWRTVSRIDGHVAGGAFGFGVGVPPSPFPRVTNPPPSPLYVVSRLLLYGGLCGLLGAAVAWMLPVRHPPAGMPARLWGLWVASAVGVLLLGVAQAREAAVDIGRLLRTSLGHALWWRAALVVGAGPAVGAGQRSGRGRRGAALALGAVVGAAMLAHVAAGHAGAVSGLLGWLGILDQWAHFIGVGVWMGALTALLVAVPRLDGAAVRWCSTGAAAALGAVAITGALRAVDALGSWAALLSTDYGRLVLVKAALFALIALLGAVARNLIADVSASFRGFRRIAAAELLTAACALAVTAFMTGLPLPSATPTPSGSAVAVSGADYATSVRVRLTVTPGLPGINRFRAGITDYDTQRPIGADRVTLRFTKPDRPGIGPSSLSLPRTADGTYEGQGANLSLAGRWSVVVIVERGNQSVEVPLQLITATPPQTVQTVQAPGQPPVYTITLSGGRTLSLYLSPGTAGPNEVHGTFVDVQSRELELARAPQITAGRLGQPPMALPVLQEGPGHFYSDGDFGPGDWQLEIVATTRMGEVLRTLLNFHL